MPEPTSIDLQRLEEMMEDYLQSLEEWFEHFYGKKFMTDNEYLLCLERFAASKNNGQVLLSLAWNTVAMYQRAFYVEFDRENYSKVFEGHLDDY